MSLGAGQALQAEVRALRTQVQEVSGGLQRQVAQEAEHQQQSLRKLQELSEALQEFNQSARNSNGEFGAQLTRMITDVQELRGAVEVNEHRLGETAQTFAERLDSLAKKAPPPREPGDDVKLPANKKEALALGRSLAKEGKAAQSRAVYRAVLKQHGRVAGIADEAALRLGDGYLAEQKFGEALGAYARVVERFGNGPRADEATYKVGLCSLALGRLEDAQTFFGEVVGNKRRSSWQRSAKAKLDEMGRQAAKKADPTAAPPAAAAP